jgi:hypothetical protein
MSYIHCLYLFTYSGVQHILCCVFVLFFFVYVASFSGLSFFDCPFGILYRLFMLNIQIYFILPSAVKINQTMIGEGVTSEPTTVEIKTTTDTTVELIDCIGKTVRLPPFCSTLRSILQQ